MFCQLRDLVRLAVPFLLCNQGKQTQRRQTICLRSRSQERPGCNAHSNLSCSVTGTWLLSHTTLSGLGGGRGRGKGVSCGERGPCAASAGLPGRGCGANKAAPPPAASQKDTEPDAGNQVTGREGSLLRTQVQRHPREARTGWAPGGSGDSSHTPACLELWSPKWASKPGSSSWGGG